MNGRTAGASTRGRPASAQDSDARIKNHKIHMIPASVDTRGHGTTGMAKFYKKELQELLASAPRKAM